MFNLFSPPAVQKVAFIDILEDTHRAATAFNALTSSGNVRILNQRVISVPGMASPIPDIEGRPPQSILMVTYEEYSDGSGY